MVDRGILEEKKRWEDGKMGRGGFTLVILGGNPWNLYLCLSAAAFPFLLSFFLFLFFDVYLFLGQRETGHEWGRGREREGDTESETGSRL